MKTIRVDGRTYAAVEVEENNLCKGCIFYRVEWDSDTPHCMVRDTPEFQCTAGMREDGKNVIFKLMARDVTED